MLDAPTVLDAPTDGPINGDGRGRGRRRRPVRRALIVTHRWLSLALGIVLLLITTSGAVLVYRPEIQRWLDAEAYAASGGPAVVSMQQAQEAVAQAHPEFVPTTVIAEHGVLRVTDFVSSYTVDPATGAVLGEVGEMPTWLGWTENLHMCLLSCEDYPGYLQALAAPVPGTAWLGHEGEPVSVGGLILGIFGVLLLFLAVSGLWLWWPRPGRYKASMTVRRGKGRFARDTDLHKVIGMIALPLLLMWGFTGAGFELGVVEEAWYALTPGTQVEAPEAVSADVSAEAEGADNGIGSGVDGAVDVAVDGGIDIGIDIGIDAAAAAALAVMPGATLAAVDIAVPDDPSAVYTVWVADGIDPYAHGDYPGDVAVAVDRHTGQTTITYGTAEEPLAQTIWDSWNFPVHAGIMVNGWWRIIWFVLGLAPLALAVTGVSTWLVRRKRRRERPARQAVSAESSSRRTALATTAQVSGADSMTPTQ